jgi:hypothetical protein
MTQHRCFADGKSLLLRTESQRKSCAQPRPGEAKSIQADWEKLAEDLQVFKEPSRRGRTARSAEEQFQKRGDHLRATGGEGANALFEAASEWQQSKPRLFHEGRGQTIEDPVRSRQKMSDWCASHGSPQILDGLS